MKGYFLAVLLCVFSGSAACYQNYLGDTPDLQKIREGNAMHAGHINVATFTPNYIAGRRFVPWKYLGDIGSTSLWYNFVAIRYGVDITIKSATMGIGDGQFTSLQFFVGHMECPLSGYPLGIISAHTYVHSPISGVTLESDIDENPMGVEIPVSRGSAIARAIKSTCDQVVKSGGNAITQN